MSRDTARKVLEIESEAIRELIARLDESFDQAVVRQGVADKGAELDFIEAILRARGDWDRVSTPGPGPPSEP